LPANHPSRNPTALSLIVDHIDPEGFAAREVVPVQLF
jgi:hypothetical protein